MLSVYDLRLWYLCLHTFAGCSVCMFSVYLRQFDVCVYKMSYVSLTWRIMLSMAVCHFLFLCCLCVWFLCLNIALVLCLSVSVCCLCHLMSVCCLWLYMSCVSCRYDIRIWVLSLLCLNDNLCLCELRLHKLSLPVCCLFVLCRCDVWVCMIMPVTPSAIISSLILYS